MEARVDALGFALYVLCHGYEHRAENSGQKFGARFEAKWTTAADEPAGGLEGSPRAARSPRLRGFDGAWAPSPLNLTATSHAEAIALQRVEWLRANIAHFVGVLASFSEPEAGALRREDVDKLSGVLCPLSTLGRGLGELWAASSGADAAALTAWLEGGLRATAACARGSGAGAGAGGTLLGHPTVAIAGVHRGTHLGSSPSFWGLSMERAESPSLLVETR